MIYPLSQPKNYKRINFHFLTVDDPGSVLEELCEAAGKLALVAENAGVECSLNLEDFKLVVLQEFDGSLFVS